MGIDQNQIARNAAADRLDAEVLEVAREFAWPMVDVPVPLTTRAAWTTGPAGR